MDRNVDPDADSLTDDVALRKESVDRNEGINFWQSIETPVALRKESVDRNIDNWTWTAGMWCRSPQGERG